MDLNDFLAIALGDVVLLAPSGSNGWRLPLAREVPQARVVRPVGRVNDRPVWLAALTGAGDEPDVGDAPGESVSGLVPVPWTDLVQLGQPDIVTAGAEAIHTAHWLSSHRYCGRCGRPVIALPDVVAYRCVHCGHFEYIKAQPVALVAVWRRSATGGTEVLLARHTYGATELWALIGGYVDAAESLEQAAVREAREEVGLDIADLRYYGSEGWGISGPTMLISVFSARAADPAAQFVVDGQEIAEARFFPLAELPPNIPPQPLIAARLLADFPVS